MQTIYVVTSGGRFDHGIDGVYSTREKAESFIRCVRANGCSHGETIEEWILDDSSNKDFASLMRREDSFASREGPRRG